ncbi:DsbA family oxidoreductase [Trueperella pecoris]|uniref:DsbA family oxidoreductase n=1 Tax=Trueperella pecoris TaxID=2733571 RepID=A0A7M1QUT6_9ACTO|nr:DsbA family oxidoreductase [Trueperella pecoris]QOR45688.1 DsbA family oxidoreductase [Trueperella pecoris]
MEHDIVVHAWADIACPWCWIGKQRLQKGIEESGQKVAVEYHSYQLRPDAPTSPTGPYAESFAEAKGFTLAKVHESLQTTAELAAAEGLTMNWAEASAVNTFLAHQLVYAAKARATTPEESALLGAKALERLYVAHFTEARNVADTDTLVEIAEELGMDPSEVSDELESGEYADAVRADIRDARALGIQGVPFYVVGGKFGISGAQPVEVFSDTIKRAVAELQVAHAQEVPLD